MEHLFSSHVTRFSLKSEPDTIRKNLLDDPFASHNLDSEKPLLLLERRERVLSLIIDGL